MSDTAHIFKRDHRYGVGRILLRVGELGHIVSRHFEGIILWRILKLNQVKMIRSVSDIWACKLIFEISYFFIGD